MIPVLVEYGLVLLTLFIGAIAITCLYLETSRKLIIALFATALISSFGAGMAHGVFITRNAVHNQIQQEEVQ